jgi:hypothetical protein
MSTPTLRGDPGFLYLDLARFADLSVDADPGALSISGMDYCTTECDEGPFDAGHHKVSDHWTLLMAVKNRNDTMSSAKRTVAQIMALVFLLMRPQP